MKVVQFLDSEHDIAGEATATSIWSVMKNGSLPTDTEYILYTVNERHLTSPLLNRVYDMVVRPPYDEDWLNSLDLNSYGWAPKNDAYCDEYRVRRKFWGKFLAFLQTPCDDSFVMHLDWDVICQGSLIGALPPHWKSWSCYCAGKYCTNGFLVKSQKFDDDGLASIMMEPLLNKEVYEQVQKIIPSADEIGTTWYREQYGDSTLTCLSKRYCGNVEAYIQNDIPISQTNDRILHYVNKTKPWQDFYPKDNPYMKLWWDYHDDMMSSVMGEN